MQHCGDESSAAGCKHEQSTCPIGHRCYRRACGAAAQRPAARRSSRPRSAAYLLRSPSPPTTIPSHSNQAWAASCPAESLSTPMHSRGVWPARRSRNRATSARVRQVVAGTRHAARTMARATCAVSSGLVEITDVRLRPVPASRNDNRLKPSRASAGRQRAITSMAWISSHRSERGRLSKRCSQRIFRLLYGAIAYQLFDLSLGVAGLTQDLGRMLAGMQRCVPPDR